MKRIIPFLIILAFIASACSTGKQAYEKGDYEKAVLASVKRLRQNPDHKKARSTLRKAYPEYLKYFQDRVNILKQSSDPYKWEKVITIYQGMNMAYDEIVRSPGAMRVIANPKSFVREHEEARKNAADARYALGNQEMAKGTRESAKEAYYHFQKALEIRSGHRDTEKRLLEARQAATLHVVIEPIPMHSQTLAISNAFFEGQMIEYFKNTRLSPFVEFYTTAEASAAGLTQPDHLIRMIFDDFVVGQTYVKEEIIPRERDSVVVGTVNITKDSVADVYGTVSAKLHVFRKSVSSSGLLDFQILDPNTRSLVTQRKFPGTFVWENQWGFFNGDERALYKEDLNIVRQKELPPPPPQQLFVEFTKPIFDQATSFVREFYVRF